MKLSSLRKQADRAYQEAGMRDNPKCLLCPQSADCLHHYVPKSVSSALRYYKPNGIPLCNGCHMRLHRSGDPEYNKRIEEKKGRDWLDDLRDERKRPVKTNVGYYKQVLLNLK